MNRKNITKIINSNVKKWLESITDIELRTFIADKIIVTGGCIPSMLLNEEVNDFDIYFTCRDAAYRIADYYIKLFKSTRNDLKYNISIDNRERSIDRVKIIVKSDGLAESSNEIENVFEAIQEDNFIEAMTAENPKSTNNREEKHSKKEYQPKSISSNAITLSDKIQVIVRFFGNPDEIHENYDFVHCTNYWTSSNNNLVLRPEALESLLSKELKYSGSKYPLCSVIRTRKFIKRGWFCSAGQYLKMLYQVSKLDLNDISVLEDQLIGVDSHYFNQIINIIQKNTKENNISIDNTYLCELIDKVF